ncbi:ATP-dependent zinc protease family protein [Micrococcus endophyticus]|uniref:ATP-dependent zinc protease family protein n=1 Tax=Micrococcus endophyticus TaxID=455343 RepID=UPI0039080F74
MSESKHTRPGAQHAPRDDDGAPRPGLVGWREWVGLPAAHTPWIKAKVDTGARTSALHAFGIRRSTRDGVDRVRFEVHPWQTSDADARTVELPVAGVRTVRSSNGEAQERVVVVMPLTLAGRTIEAEVTLTHRDEMGFRMLVGRTALAAGGLLVDPAASYVGGQPPRGVRRRNRGRA